VVEEAQIKRKILKMYTYVYYMYTIQSIRMEYCKKRIKKIRHNLTKKEAVIIQWGEKLSPTLTGNDLVDRLPISDSIDDFEQQLHEP